jgi:hypothetical protein
MGSTRDGSVRADARNDVGATGESRVPEVCDISCKDRKKEPVTRTGSSDCLP